MFQALEADESTLDNHVHLPALNIMWYILRFGRMGDKHIRLLQRKRTPLGFSLQTNRFCPIRQQIKQARTPVLNKARDDLLPTSLTYFFYA